MIEHVSSWENQKRLSDEIRRVASPVWIQTPAHEFFVEPHLLTPFIHWLPRSWRRRMLRNATVWGWVSRPTEEEVEEFHRTVRLITFDEWKSLFPDCDIHIERWLGMPKSYVAYRI